MGKIFVSLIQPVFGLGWHLVSRINTGSKEPTSVVLAEAIPALYISTRQGRDLRLYQPCYQFYINLNIRYILHMYIPASYGTKITLGPNTQTRLVMTFKRKYQQESSMRKKTLQQLQPINWEIKPCSHKQTTKGSLALIPCLTKKHEPIWMQCFIFHYFDMFSIVSIPRRISHQMSCLKH